MLPLTESHLSDEYKHAIEFREKHTRKLRRLVERYTGNWFREDLTTDPTPENTVFSWVWFMLPQLSYAAPAARVQAVWQSTYGELAKLMEAAYGHWTPTQHLNEEVELLVRDALLGYGFCKVGVEAQGDDNARHEDTAQHSQPFFVHRDATSLGLDPRASHWRRCRFMFDEFWKDLDEIRQTPGADPELVASIVSEYETAAAQKPDEATRPGETAERKQVLVVEWWFPETRQVATMVKQGDTLRFIRPPRKWFGPRSGPFFVLGYGTVEKDPYPMSPLQAVMEQIEEMNRHVTAASKEAGTLKSFIGVDAGNLEAAEAVKQVKNGEVVLIPGLNRGDVKDMSVGGVDGKRMEHINTLRERVDRILAYSDAQRGAAKGGVTATADEIAKGSSDIRVQGFASKTNAIVSEAMTGVGWYMFYDPDYQQRLTLTDQASGQTIEGTFHGGTEARWMDPEPTSPPTVMVGAEGGGMGMEGMGAPMGMGMGAQAGMGDPMQPAPAPGPIFVPAQVDVTWESDFRVTIDPNSMRYVDDQVVQTRALQLIGVMQQVGQGMSTMPFWNWNYAVNQFGESFNQKDLYGLLMNPQYAEQLKQLGQMQMQGQMPLLEGMNPELMGHGQPVNRMLRGRAAGMGSAASPAAAQPMQQAMMAGAPSGGGPAFGQ